MQSESLSLSEVIPVEIINLVIHESSRSTLHAWCLVSLGSLSIAGPLLNEHVQIPSQKYLLRVLQRMTFAEDDPLIRHLPRLSSSLSLKNVRRLSFLTRPKAIAKDWDTLSNAPSQPRRRSLLVEFGWKYDEKEEGEELGFRAILLPRIIRLLRPGGFSGVISLMGGPYEPYLLTSTALQSYAAIVSMVAPVPIEGPLQDELHTHALLHLTQTLAIVINQQARRDLLLLMLEGVRRHFLLSPESSLEGARERSEALWVQLLEEERVRREGLERTEDKIRRAEDGEWSVVSLYAPTARSDHLHERLLAQLAEAMNHTPDETSRS